MPRKRTVTELVEEVPPSVAVAQPEAEAPDTPQQEVNESGEIQEFLTGLALPDNQLKIYRYQPDGSLSYVGIGPMTGNIEEHIKSEFGGGKYKLLIVDGRNRLQGRKTLYIAGPPADRRPQVPPSPPPPPQVQSVPDTVGLQIQFLQQELAAQRQLITSLLEKLATRDGSSGSTMKELLEAITVARGLMTPQNPVSAVSDIIGVLRQGIEIGASGGLPERSIWESVAGEMIKVLPNILGGLRGRAAAPAPAENPPDGDMLREKIAAGLAYLKGRAERGTDPNLWVDVILQNLDDPQWRPFISLLDRPFEEFASIDPDINRPPYQAFFRSIYDGVKQALAAPAEQEAQQEDADEKLPQA